MAHEVCWSEEAMADLLRVPIFHRRRVVGALDQLRSEPTVETRHRKPLLEPLEGLPEETWELRVGAYRVLYWTDDGQTVQLLRVILKGPRTTEAAMARRKKP